MRKFKVEYLIVVDLEGVVGSSIQSFNKLMHAIDGISKIDSNTIEYKSLKVDYNVRDGKISADKQYFHITLTCENEKRLDEFDNLLKSIRTILYKQNSKPVEVLWDDIGFLYARKAYPLIYDIENTMRKLITKFMLINAGLKWTDKAVPPEVNESIRDKTQKKGQNYLYELDFIQLINLLFKEYPPVNTKTLIDRIKVSEVKDLDLSGLKEFIPKSNWERYFSTIVNCESDYLRKKWEQLYERRNQIAHNKPITREEYEEIVELVNDLNSKLHKALENLDQINVPQEERENVAENVAENIDTLFGEFFQLWKDLQDTLQELVLVDTNSEEWKRVSKSRDYINWLLKRSKKLISSDMRKKIGTLNEFRDVIIHHSDAIFKEESIKVYGIK